MPTHPALGDDGESIEQSNPGLVGKVLEVPANPGLPRSALGLVVDWAELHQNELRDNWTLAQQRKPIKNMNPLE